MTQHNAKQLAQVFTAALKPTKANTAYIMRCINRHKQLMKRFGELRYGYPICIQAATKLIECSVHPLRSSLIDLCPMPNEVEGNTLLCVEFLCAIIACDDEKLPVDTEYSTLARRLAAKLELALCTKATITH